MKDNFGREISYLRVSVTTRCNLNCIYCGKESCAKKETELTSDEIFRLVKAFAACGITKVRITGGEPLVRDDICEIIEKIRAIDGIQTIALTTNGVHLKKYAQALKNAGLQGVNISLDSTNESTYRHLTGAAVLKEVLAGIEAAQAAGLSPVKINAVLMKGINSDGAGALIELARNTPTDVRFIELMPFSESGENRDLMVSGDNILKQFSFLQPMHSEASTARYYRAEGFLGRVGLINSVSGKFCADCNRIRLLSDGQVKPCLGDDTTYDLLPFMGDAQALKKEIERIIRLKPEGHHFEKGSLAHGLNKTGG